MFLPFSNNPLLLRGTSHMIVKHPITASAKILRFMLGIVLSLLYNNLSGRQDQSSWYLFIWKTYLEIVYDTVISLYFILGYGRTCVVI